MLLLCVYKKKTWSFFVSKLSAHQRSDLAHQPHACCLQVETSNPCRVPVEVVFYSTSAKTIDATREAGVVPESAAVHCAVDVVAVMVVVTVMRGEHHAVVVVECITGVTRVSGHAKLVVTRLPVHQERTVLGVVPGEITCLEVKSQLVVAV